MHPVNGLMERKNIQKNGKAVCPQRVASTMQQVARVLLELGGRMTYFKMTKLMYLVDLFALEKLGHMVASNIYLRQVEGPWPPDLDKTLQAMQGHEVLRSFARRIPVVGLGPSPRFEVQLDDDILGVISDVFRIYGSMSNAEIKTAVYRTDPMQFVLRGREQR